MNQIYTAAEIMQQRLHDDNLWEQDILTTTTFSYCDGQLKFTARFNQYLADIFEDSPITTCARIFGALAQEDELLAAEYIAKIDDLAVQKGFDNEHRSYLLDTLLMAEDRPWRIPGSPYISHAFTGYVKLPTISAQAGIVLKSDVQQTVRF